MKALRPVAAVLAGLAVLAVAVAAWAAHSDITPIPAFEADELTEVPGNDWPAPHGNIYNQQYSKNVQVGTTNVKQLKLAWHTRVLVPTKGKPKFTGVSAEAEPVVYQGTMYMPDAKGNVYAVDAVTGERLWYYKPKYPKGFAPALPTSRGVTIGDGKVYHAQLDATIVGLDQATGRVAWKTRLGDFKKGYFFTAAPTYVNGLVIAGTSGGDFGARCRVVALDAKTGKLKWSFAVIPTKPQFGYKTWPARRAYTGGGAVWATLPVDAKLGLVYVGVGNPVPYNGNVRAPGDELFTESIVALNLNTGKYVWHYQTTHHDNWDYDTAANPLVLFDLKIKGRNRQAVAHAGKTGWVFILDRRNGKPIIGIPERKVPQEPSQHTSPTQPIPIGQPFAAQCAPKSWLRKKAPDGKPYKLGCIYTPYTENEYTAFAPGALGGTDWPPSSYSPRTGYLYICSKDSSTAWKALPEEKAGKLKPLGNFFQIDGLFPTPGTPATKTPGAVVAMNMRTNRVAWRASFPTGDICYSGVLSTAGGLVFVGRNNRYLEAYDDQTGKLLWRSPKLLASVNAPPMTYTVDNKQYVAVYAGGNGVVSFAGNTKAKYGSELYAFALPS
jgi:quinohemoprotein ethanol dehydrogenase